MDASLLLADSCSGFWAPMQLRVLYCIVLCYRPIIFTTLYYIIESTPQERFLDHIEDDEARAIVRRSLIPAERIQIRAELGKGTLIRVQFGKIFSNDDPDFIASLLYAVMLLVTVVMTMLTPPPPPKKNFEFLRIPRPVEIGWARVGTCCAHPVLTRGYWS